MLIWLFCPVQKQQDKHVENIMYIFLCHKDENKKAMNVNK